MNKKVILKIERTSKREFLSKIPSSPGVYIFLSKEKNVLYIGKSKNLKNRVSSYFLNLITGKTRKMINQSAFLSFFKTGSEIEALLLEASLIKKYKPKYNVIQKDDKSPIYIIITKEKLPRLVLGRKADTQKENVKSFYGPFLSTRVARNLLRNARKFIPFSDHKIGKKPCIYSQIGLCKPCPNFIEGVKNQKEKNALIREYLKNIKKLNYFFRADIKRLEKELEAEMRSAAKAQDFEKALSIKEKIEIFKFLTKPTRNPDEYLQNPNLIEDQRKREVKSLEKFLSGFFKIRRIRRIECYDVSHISGVCGTASMVVFTDGEKNQQEYRHFKLKESSNNDLQSLFEVIRRRLKHLKDWGMPDLIVIDGGKPQLSAVIPILAKYKIPVVAIAKKLEEIVIPVRTKGYNHYLKYHLKDKDFGNLIIRIRDESHRFAKKYHHYLIKKQQGFDF